MSDHEGEPAPAAQEAQRDTDQDTEQVFGADYVRQLREEAAAHRVKAKRVDDANARLLASYASADGRLVDPAELQLQPALLDESGLVDPGKVADAIEQLVHAKPYLAARQVPAIAQGVMQTPPAEESLFDLMRQRM